jgi:vacuolar protein sorting-associated protein 26
MTSYWFGSPVDVDIRLEGEETRKQLDVKVDKERKESMPIYYDGESIIGQVCLGTTLIIIQAK